MQQRYTAVFFTVRVERRGKSSPAQWRHCGPVNPIRSNTDMQRALCYVCSTESARWQRALWQHKAKIDDCSRQNPAYSPGRTFSLSKEKVRKKKRIRDYIMGWYYTSDARVQYRLVGINPTDQTQNKENKPSFYRKVTKASSFGYFSAKEK